MRAAPRLLVLGLIAVGSLSSRWAAADLRKQPPPTAQLPPAQLGLWLDGFHKVDGHPNEQMEVHHFCAAPKQGPIQCALWNGSGADAKLIGIEYIIDADTFNALPPEEKRFWHSHVHEVTSGALVAPGKTEQEENDFFKKSISTYGKTWHTWDEGRSAKVPLGRPELMMSFTEYGVLRPELVRSRDQSLGLDTSKLRERRAQAITDIPKVASGADAGENGRSCQPCMEKMKRAARRSPRK
jgi:hypothetical protein